MNFPLPSRFNQNTRAVTLVEILVCLGITVILVALLYPAASTVIRRGRDSKCLANHRSIIQATMAYTADHGGTLPGNATDNLTHQKLGPYLGIEWSKNEKWLSMWFCPSRSAGFGKFPFPTYAFTNELFGLRVKQPAPDPPTGRFPVNVAAINQPSKSAAFACVTGNYALFQVYAYTNTADSPSALAQLAPWHRGGTVITFMDGHSEMVEAFPETDKRRNWFSLNNPNVP